MSFHSQRFGRAAQSYLAHAQVQKEMADILISLLPSDAEGIEPAFPGILEMGCGTGLFTEKIAARFPNSRMYITDASQKMLDATKVKFAGEAQQTRAGEKHFSILDASGKMGSGSQIFESAPFGLAASNALVQWFSDLGQHFQMVSSRLSENGVYLVSGFSLGNFPELNSLLKAPPFNYTDFPGHLTEDIQLAATQAGFGIEKWHSEPIETIYSSPEAFLAVIRGLGSSRRPNSTPLTQAKLVFLIERYRACYSCLGGVKATWIPWYALLRKL